MLLSPKIVNQMNFFPSNLIVSEYLIYNNQYNKERD